MALLYMPSPLRLADLDVWVKSEARKMQRDLALSILRIIAHRPDHAARQGPAAEMHLTTNFKNSLRIALEGGGTHSSFGVPSALPVDPTIDLAYLDRYARKKWEDILHYVVNSVSDTGSGSGSGAYRRA